MDKQNDSPQLTPRLEAVLKHASADAIGRGQSYIGVEHVMLAIITEGASASAQLLHLHSDLSSLTAAVEVVLSGGNASAENSLIATGSV